MIKPCNFSPGLPGALKAEASLSLRRGRPYWANKHPKHLAPSAGDQAGPAAKYKEKRRRHDDWKTSEEE